MPHYNILRTYLRHVARIKISCEATTLLLEELVAEKEKAMDHYFKNTAEIIKRCKEVSVRLTRTSQVTGGTHIYLEALEGYGNAKYISIRNKIIEGNLALSVIEANNSIKANDEVPRCSMTSFKSEMLKCIDVLINLNLVECPSSVMRGGPWQ